MLSLSGPLLFLGTAHPTCDSHWQAVLSSLEPSNLDLGISLHSLARRGSCANAIPICGNRWIVVLIEMQEPDAVGTLTSPETPPLGRGVWLIGATVVPAETQARSVIFRARNIVISLPSLSSWFAPSSPPAGDHGTCTVLEFPSTAERHPADSASSAGQVESREEGRGWRRNSQDWACKSVKSQPLTLRSSLRPSFHVVNSVGQDQHVVTWAWRQPF